MFCIKCGKEIKEENKFCTNCGANLKEQEEQIKKQSKPVEEEKLTYSQNQSIPTSSNLITVEPVEKDGKATASLVLGIISFAIPCLNIITSIIGLILGIVSKERSGKRTAGIILNSIVLGFMIILFSLAMFSGIMDEFTNPKNPNPSSDYSDIFNNKNESYKLGEKFEFDDLEITLGTTYSFEQIDNSFSDKNGMDVVKLPITVKNKSNKSKKLNMFFYEVYGSNGTELETVAAYFNESVDFAGNLQPEASYDKYMYFIYDGDGNYTIEFDNYKDKVKVEFNIKK